MNGRSESAGGRSLRRRFPQNRPGLAREGEGDNGSPGVRKTILGHLGDLGSHF